jgi:Fe-Mn family superoxide dismutase
MDTMAYMRLQRDFGTFDDWQSDFMACAMSCGQGWAVCVYNLFLRKYVNTTISNHSQDVMVGLYPIIVVDCWEHSFLRDYLGDKKSYLVAMMRELNWEVIEERFKKAESICEVTK